MFNTTTITNGNKINRILESVLIVIDLHLMHLVFTWFLSEL